MNKRIFSLFLLASLFGCSRGSSLYVLNNTGQNITIQSRDKVYIASPGAVVEVKWPADTMTLTIQRESGPAWQYAVTRINKELLSKRYEIPVQLQADGTIYLRASNTKNIDQTFPNQPEGMPWRPKTAGVTNNIPSK